MKTVTADTRLLSVTADTADVELPLKDELLSAHMHFRMVVGPALVSRGGAEAALGYWASER